MENEDKILESSRLSIMDMDAGRIALEKDSSFDDHASALTVMSDRLYFNENLMDLYIMDVIDKKAFIKLRKWFRNPPENENRILAERMVAELHKQHIQ